ncbi:triacylglycerol lipase OBL1-like [Gastrolobium bilobum]|uniref:triacylglycerol lipase OBL1-like n=1 Tax=Gastrolobium bilobum TaxID=150636 RepID=UPI002AB09617|nr:triacylglycerol lipase OBL1-like [Gastrolobium bilobum]
MVSEQPFGWNYMLLKPEEASLVDLGRLLFTSNLNSIRFIECPEGLEVKEFWQRELFFISVVLQKVLLTSGNSMKRVGDMLELWLNRLSCNGGLIGLFLNILRENMITPERSSAAYLSLVGNLDIRVDLDRSIKPEDARYKGMLSMMCSKLSYENEQFISNAVRSHWDMDFLGRYDTFWNDYQHIWSTRAIIVRDTKSEPNLIVVAFMGTQPFDADSCKIDVDISWYEVPNMGKIHGGFMKALGMQKNSGWPTTIEQSTQHHYAYYTIREKLKEILLEAKEDTKFILAGHSFGGSLAILVVALLAFHKEEWLLDRLEGVYTFGQSKVGDHQFGEFMKAMLRKYDVRYMRYVYSNDMVPRIPYDGKGIFFKHFGPCLYFNSLYRGQVLGEAPDKNYFSLLCVTPKILNAFWEFIRGFLLPLVKGKEYKSSWFMVMFRLCGLIFPGVPAHLVTDYINVTRLGSLHELRELESPQQSKVD